MSKAKTAPRQNKRGSPEAIEKRRAARMFNDVLGGHAAGGKLDGRTEKRRARLLSELESGKTRGDRELKPLDVLQHVQELLALGETAASIRKAVKPRRTFAQGDAPEALADVVGRLHKAYAFRVEVYRFVGIGDEVLKAAGVLEGPKARGKKRS